MNDNQARRVAGLLRETAAADAAAGVKPFLADRVMRRVAAARQSVAPEQELFQWLLMVFRPVAAAGLVVALALAAHNLYMAEPLAAPTSVVESIFAVPEVSTVSAYELDLISTAELP